MPLPNSILHLLEQLITDERRMPPTILYNEGWMLRLVLQAGSRGYLPHIAPIGVRWFSEAQLRSPFGRDRGPKHEANTHADAVVGDFKEIVDTKSGVEVCNDAKLFLVLEAKMSSPLSSGTKNAPGYDQAARNVACIAHTLQMAQRKPESMEKVGFYVIAPKSQIDSGLFEEAMSFSSIRKRVDERMNHFTGESRDALTEWYRNWFCPLTEKMERDKTLRCIPWESLIQQIAELSADAGAELRDFYDKCKQFNLAVSTSTDRTGLPTRGREYRLSSGQRKGQRVRVGSVGPRNSRVYIENSLDDSFLAMNTSLEPLPEAEQTPSPPDPISGRQYLWKTERNQPIIVEVINSGECNSRVKRVAGNEASFKVPNHQLFEFNVSANLTNEDS